MTSDPSSSESVSSEVTSTPLPTPPSGGKRICMKESNTFPWILHAMLDSAEQKGFEGIVSWLPDGISFKVHNSTTFVTDVLPSFFLQTKYKSFQRQLNIWGFERIASGPNKGGYTRTEHFVKGRASLVKAMKRRKKSHANRATLMEMSDATCPSPDAEVITGDTRDGVWDEGLQTIVPSSNVSVSVNGEDECQNLPQQLMEESSQSENGDDEEILPFQCDDDSFGHPGGNDAKNDGYSMQFEGKHFFFLDDGEEDPLWCHLQQLMDVKDEALKDDPFCPTPISSSSVHRKRSEEMSVFDWLVASTRRSSINGAGASNDLAKCTVEIPSSSSEDTSRTCQKIAVESQTSIQNHNSFLNYGSNKPHLVLPAMDVSYEDDYDHYPFQDHTDKQYYNQPYQRGYFGADAPLAR